MSEVNPRPTRVLKNATVWAGEHELQRAELSDRCVLSKGILEAETRQFQDAQTVAELP